MSHAVLRRCAGPRLPSRSPPLPGSPWSILFPVLFGAGMGIKTLVQATAAPEFLGEEEYGALQGIITLPVLVSQAAAPFIAAYLWQSTGNYDLLQSVLLAASILSALAFALAALLKDSREKISP